MFGAVESCRTINTDQVVAPRCGQKLPFEAKRFLSTTPAPKRRMNQSPQASSPQNTIRRDRPRCGAKTRAGGACLVRVEAGKARCRFHGGLSTGPKSEAGRSRIAEAQRRRWRAYRASQTTNQLAIVGPGGPPRPDSPEPAGAVAESSATHLAAGAKSSPVSP
jgi:hypothetical protein